MTPQQREARSREIRHALVMVLSEVALLTEKTTNVKAIRLDLERRMARYLDLKREEA